MLVKTKRPDAGGDRLLEQGQRAGDVGVDEVLAARASRRAACAAWRRGRRRRRPRIAPRTSSRSATEPTTDVYGRREHVEADGVGQDAHQRLAEMTRAAGDEDPHVIRIITASRPSPKAGNSVRAERRDLGDPAVGHPQHVELERAERVVAGRAEVARRRRRAVGARSARAATRPSRAALAHQPADRVAALEEHRLRRHRDADVVGEQLQRAVDVAALVRRDEARRAARARSRSPRGELQSSRRSAGSWRLQRLARPLQRAVDRRRRRCSSTSAASAALQPSTSRRISTARWRGGSCWITTRNASSIVSRSTTRSRPGSSSTSG